MAARVVIKMGLKRSLQAWKIASSAVLPSLRSACRAKSIIMMAFFCTIPMSRMMPMSAITLNSVRVISRARRAPTPAEGSEEMMVMGWM